MADLNDDALALFAADPSRTLNDAVELAKYGGMTADVAARVEPYEGQASCSSNRAPPRCTAPALPT